MSTLYNNNITTTSGFTLNGDKPIDDRLAVETYADLATITPYEGLIVYVQSEQKHYTYIPNPWKILVDNTSNSGSANDDNTSIWTAIEELQGTVSSLGDTKQDKITDDSKLNVSAVEGLATVATSGNYNDLTNKPAVIIEGDPRLTNERKPVQHNHSPEEIICVDERQFVSADEKTIWNNKQEAITENNKLNVLVVDGLATVATSGKYTDLTDTPNVATKDSDGLMSATDKTNLDFLVDSFTNEEAGTTLETIKEVLKAFEDMPEGADIVAALENKADIDHTHSLEDLNEVATAIVSLEENKQNKLTEANKLDVLAIDGLSDVAISGSYKDLVDIQEVEQRIDTIEANYAKTSDIEEYFVKSKVFASFGNTTVAAASLSELLLALYNGFTDGAYTAPQNKTITYSVYGYNEFGGNLIDGVSTYITFSINGLFSNVNIKGYDNAEINYVDLLTKSGPKFLFADIDSTYNVNVSISDINFLSNTPKSTSWEYAYFKFHVGYDGNLFVDNCSFSNNGLMLQYGITNSVKNCKFNSTVSSKYALWVGVNGYGKGYLDTLQNVIIDGCSFTGYRAVKILTDAKTTSTAAITPRESQSITIRDCFFQNITAKPALLVDCVLKYVTDPSKADQYLSASSFGTGESKLTLLDNVFENCANGDIIIDENFAQNGYIYYSSNDEVSKLFNNLLIDDTLQCTAELKKGSELLEQRIAVLEVLVERLTQRLNALNALEN